MLQPRVMKRINRLGIYVAGASFGIGVAALAGAQESILDHMHDHYDSVVRIQSAIIAGSLETTREPAR